MDFLQMEVVNLRRSVLASLGLALSLLISSAGMPGTAEAAAIGLSIGTSLNRGRPIVCQTGVDRLRARGFHDVWRVDCRNRLFVYRAWRGGNRFEVVVNRHNGRVVGLRRIG
jgi:hypothetical protein